MCSKPLNALTIDVEDWFQLAHYKLLRQTAPVSKRVQVNTHLVLDMLGEHNVRATFFVLGTVAEQFPELVRRIKQEGHEVATHGFAHRRIAQQGPAGFEADLRRSISILEDIIQAPVLGHRAAEFSLSRASQWALEIMVAAGLRYDSSVFPIHHLRYGNSAAPRHPHLIHTPAGTLVEFPLATMRFLGQNLPIAGGGYLRILPLTLIKSGIQILNRQEYLAVTYIHPYELEEEWLDLPVSTRSAHRWLGLRMRALKRNWGRGHPMRAKFKALLQSFSFVPLREVIFHGAEWQNSDVLSTARPAIRPVVSTGSPPP